jgi:methylase of polypeptide subunit release factors
VDFGSGSGAIVLSLLHSFPSAKAVAVDPKEAAGQQVILDGS